MSDTLISITFSLIICFIGAQTLRRLRYPPLIGQLLAGLIIAVPAVQGVLFPAAAREIIAVLADIAVLFLLLLTGFEINLKQLRAVSLISLFIAVFGIISTFSLAALLANVAGLDVVAGLVLGLCLSVTAASTAVGLLINFDRLDTRLGTILIGAAVMVDVLAVVGFSTLIIVLQHDTTALINLPYHFLLFGVFAWVMYHLTPRVVRAIENQHSQISLFDITIIIGLLFALVAELAGLGGIIGAFLGGIVLQHALVDQRDRLQEKEDVELVTFGFIVPFFFVHLGLQIDYGSLFAAPLLVSSILGVALVGKFIGTFLTLPFNNLSFRQLMFIGWGMNVRGVLELVIAGVARQNGLIGDTLFSAIVLATVTTTVIAPFAMRMLLEKKHPNWWNPLVWTGFQR